MKEKLSNQERTFCELFVNGCAPYAGNIEKCYSDAFQKQDKTLCRQEAVTLMSQPKISKYIKELKDISAEGAEDMKRFLTANLKSIVEEATHFNMINKSNGDVRTPAAMRSVAVNAAKALMEMYPVREAQVSKVDINGGDGAGITFNVIVPGAKTQG